VQEKREIVWKSLSPLIGGTLRGKKKCTNLRSKKSPTKVEEACPGRGESIVPEKERTKKLTKVEGGFLSWLLNKGGRNR